MTTLRRALLAAMVMTGSVKAMEAVPAARPRQPVDITLQWNSLGIESGRGEVRVAGLSVAAIAGLSGVDLAGGAGESVLRVVVAPSTASEATAAALPALWGVWAIEGDALAFRPRHVLAPGTTLRAHFDGTAFGAIAHTDGIPDASLRYEIAASANVTRVIGVSPGGDTLPQNLLRLYVEFSHPMSLRDVERHVHLLRTDGVAIPQAFANPADGLWDPARRRLTLIVHPGRVKSGLALGDALGPVLLAGESVTLVVDPAMRDADGGTLREGFSRTWRIAPPVREPIDLARWQLRAPTGERDHLRIHTPHGLDRALALRTLSVIGPDATPLRGTIELLPGERELRFLPERPWQRGGRYRLVASPALEDASGNRLSRAFERDIASSSPALGETSEIEFLVSATSAGAGPEN